MKHKKLPSKRENPFKFVICEAISFLPVEDEEECKKII